MKRGSPPQRKTPLKRSGQLKRTPFKRNGKPLKRSAAKASGRVAGPTRDVVDAVQDRGQHSCERCGIGVGPRRGEDHHIHHRRLKGNGGTEKPDAHLPQNLLLLCPPCHEVVHGPGRAEWERHGWIVPQSGDPAAVPVLILFEHYRYLTTDGRYSRTPPPKEDAVRYPEETPEPTPAQREADHDRATGRPSAEEQYPLTARERRLIDGVDADRRQPGGGRG
jgi:5-methylcytosine-specific restriction endonuclease McrA